jgi:hypothetical protein
MTLEESVQGHTPNEVKRIVTKLSKEIRTADNGVPQGLFRESPHITWDNFFSSKEVAIWCAGQGFGMTTTLRRDRFPKDVPKEFFHEKKRLQKTKERRLRSFSRQLSLQRRSITVSYS